MERVNYAALFSNRFYVTQIKYCHVLGEWLTYRQGLDWMIGFIDILYTYLLATINYSAIAIFTLYSCTTHTSVLNLH
jgi:hypothetical protein